MPNRVSRETEAAVSKETILSIALMLVPAAILAEMASQILPLVLTVFEGDWDSKLLSGYALFLGLYLFYIFLNEYWKFGVLHALKSRPVDFLLLAIMFMSIRRLGESAGSIVDAFSSLAVFLFALIVWELVTMGSGYRNHFRVAGGSLSLRELAVLCFSIQTLNADPRSATHWDEYRYWLISDSFLLILVVAGWVVFSQTSGVPEFIPRVCICAVGYLVGAFNIMRYNIGERRWREALTTA